MLSNPLKILFAIGLLFESVTSSTLAQQESETTLEVISVSVSRHRQGESLISEYISIDEVVTPASSFADMLALEPSVSLNGQPGLFQTLNVRGMARQRVQSFLNGMRLTSERRAGVSSSFIDPLLLSGAEVIQGPASTYYGSGALGGALQLLTREDSSPWFSSGFGSDGNERNLAAGTGAESFSAGLAFRQRDDGETVRGDRKQDRFTQLSGYYNRQFRLGDYSVDWQLIGSRGEDIGKDNRQFPLERVITYPEENHLFSQVEVSGTGDWAARLSLHHQDLITNERQPPTLENEVETSSLDIGFSLEDRWQAGGFSGQIGVDYFGRRQVSAKQTDFDASSGTIIVTQPLDDGEENESALFATMNRDFDSFSVHAGARFTYFTQDDIQAENLSDDNDSYFITLRKPLGNWQIDLSFGTSTRFASLTERFFTGLTGRGQTIGNPSLISEDSNQLDLGLTYQGDSLSLQLHRFEMDIDHFIERIELSENTFGFRNVNQGELDGWQYQVALFPDNQWQLEFSGQGITGVNENGMSLTDIPAKRHQLDIVFDAARWSTRLSLRRQLEKRAFGPTEMPLEAANIGALNFNYTLNDRWRLQAVIENLFNETYFNSADALTTLAIGREFMIGIHYQ
ncbi:MAG: TonB-dependent receptor [Pseudomonadales bacterium]|nr:TonB-dependent receptor [Pseudomonadales bacterium]